MMSGQGINPVFFNKKNKYWMSRKQQKYQPDFNIFIMTSLSDVGVKWKISCQ